MKLVSRTTAVVAAAAVAPILLVSAVTFGATSQTADVNRSDEISNNAASAILAGSEFDRQEFPGLGVALEGATARDSAEAKVTDQAALVLAETVGVVQEQARGISPKVTLMRYAQSEPGTVDKTVGPDGGDLVWDVAYIGTPPDFRPPPGAKPRDPASFGVCESHILVDATKAEVLQIFQHCPMNGQSAAE